ncbi:MAG: ribosome recycling factor [Gammaproteobacteria bacterium]|nr:ribosome recycling factor [Gammaproteobacteria bacterium]
MINEVTQDADKRMAKSIDALKHDLTKLRTGRAHPSLLEHIKVSYYGSETPLSQVANIAIENSRTLAVTTWEKDMIGVVEKAIRTSDLGLNPATAGTVIRVPLPPLNEERRRDLVKVIRELAEEARVAIRNIRRDANQMLKDLLKEKAITEDDERRGEVLIQKITDKHVGDIDKIIASKEADLMAI